MSSFAQRLTLLLALVLSHTKAHPSPFHPRNLFRRGIFESIDWSGIHFAEPKEGWENVHIDEPKGGWENVDYSGGQNAGKDLPWNDPGFYHDTPAESAPVVAEVSVEVSNQGTQPSMPEQPNGGTSEGVQAQPPAPDQPGVHTQAPPQQTDVSSQPEAPGNDDDSSTGKSKGKCGKSSAQCPPGCQMTIKFTSDSMAVPFTPGAGGHSKDKTTQNSCICMTGGSVRVNVGTTDPSKHTTLIEGNAAGLNDNSFFDVSYVEGYNYPVVCWNDKDPSRMSGHNADLYKRGKCSDPSKKKMGDICTNDGYDKLVLATPDTDCWKCTLPSTFFEAAAGAAYTYPYDDCPCASDPMPDKNYQSPMANGGEITCCVGPDCCENTMSHGGQTKKGNCNRSDCKPCNAGFSWGHCSSACDNKKNKRSFERVLEQHSLRKRQKHHHHHSH